LRCRFRSRFSNWRSRNFLYGRGFFFNRNRLKFYRRLRSRLRCLLNRSGLRFWSRGRRFFFNWHGFGSRFWCWRLRYGFWLG
jgi:hypothetical protein